MPFMDTFLHFRERTASSRRGAVSGADREKVGKKGVVRDKGVHLEVIDMVIRYAVSIGFEVLNLEFSPIKGPEGNIEYLLHLQNHRDGEHYDNVTVDPAQVVEAAHSELDK